MGGCCDDAPLIDIWPVDLDSLISAVSSVPIMTTGHVDFLFHHTGSSVSNTFKRTTKVCFDLTLTPQNATASVYDR